MQIIDRFLNKITMYKLTLSYLIGLVAAAVVLSFFNILSYNPFDILLDVCISLFFCLVSNYIFAKFFKAVTNSESVFITALILVFLIPVKFPVNSVILAITCIFAMGSKYFVTIEKRHIFNPAAAAIAGVALLSAEHSATWWVGTPAMIPCVLVGGLLLIRKLQHEDLIFTFLLTYFIVAGGATFLRYGSLSSVLSLLQVSLFHSALLFFTFVMLTEPLTSPTRKKQQNYFAMLVAILYATPQLRVFNFAITPELVLCAGNVFSYIISPKYRFALPLILRQQLSPDSYLFVFDRPQNFKFTAGQYMEWTLPHNNVDSRGNRRYFSIASSPSEKNLSMLVKFYSPSSSYKKGLIALPTGREVIASQLAGDFTLPKDSQRPLVFIAGGVGIAPFRSMIQDIIDRNVKVNIVLLYANRHLDDILFADVFKKAEANGVKTIYTLTDTKSVPANWTGRVGYITEAMVQQDIPDFAARSFYISGPQLMVESFAHILDNVGVAKSKIVLDYFPGYTDK